MPIAGLPATSTLPPIDPELFTWRLNEDAVAEPPSLFTTCLII